MMDVDRRGPAVCSHAELSDSRCEQHWSWSRPEVRFDYWGHGADKVLDVRFLVMLTRSELLEALKM